MAMQFIIKFYIYPLKKIDKDNHHIKYHTHISINITMEMLDVKKDTKIINSINSNRISCYCYYYYVEQENTDEYQLVDSISNYLLIDLLTNNYMLSYSLIDLFFKRISKIPKNTTYIICEYELNKTIHIPSDTTHLIFDACFNKNIIIPNKITHITFGLFYGHVCKYNLRFQFSCKNIRPIFSQNITFITFKNQFNKKLIIPQNVTHLNLPSSEQYKIPYNTTHLNINKCKYIPKYIKRLRCTYLKNKTLPQNITHLHLSPNFSQKIKIPQNVIHLCIECHSNIKIIIPNNVTHLCNRDYFNEKTYVLYVPKHIKIIE